MMRKGELSKLARIRVDIPNTLDGLWTLDIKKSSAIPPEEVRDNLVHIIDRIGEKSKVKFTRRGKIETDDAQVHLWNRLKAREGGFYYEINKTHPLVDLIASELGDTKTLYSLLTQIERNLPLNQLYIDLNNDEHIENDKIQEDSEIEGAVMSMLPQSFTKDEKIAFLNKLKDIPPYKDYESILSKKIKEIEEQ